MNELQLFKNDQFEIRATVKDGEPWFVLKDVCAAFGEQNYRRVTARLEEDEKGVSQINTPSSAVFSARNRRQYDAERTARI